MTVSASADGSYSNEMTPSQAELPGTGRFDFTKQWVGDIEGTAQGSMFSAGDPGAGTAGYVAQEVFGGRIGSRRGTLVFHQFGRIFAGSASQRYEIAPGSGTDGLAGISGTLNVEGVDGQHRVTLSYDID